MDGSDIPTGQVRKKAAKNVRDGSSIPQKTNSIKNYCKSISVIDILKSYDVSPSSSSL